MWIDSVIEYDIIVETLTGAEIEVTVTDDDTVGYIKAHIQKYEGIPIRQQHLIFNQRELSDATEVKEVPLSHGSRLKLVLGLKGGPISAQRRLVKMPDLDTWFDLNSVKQDQFTISSPGVKLLVYKDCKKNVQRVKLRTDRKSSSGSSAKNVPDDVDDQFFMDNINTMEKMHQLRTQLELKKRDRISKHFNKSGTKSVDSDDMVNGKMQTKSLDDEENACGGSDDIGAIGGATYKMTTATSKAARKYNRRISLPPLKGFIENATSLKKPSRTETKSLVTDSKALTNKHQTPIQKAKPISSEANTSPLMNETSKSKRKITKMNWIQNLIEIMKTSKMPLSPGELNEIKESFQSIRESMGTYRPAEKSPELKQSPYESMLSNFSKATTISTEPYRPKIRDNIRRSHSFRIGSAEESVIEENPEQHTKYAMNPVSKSKSGHDFHFNRSMDDLVETSNRSGSLSSLRSFGANSGPSAAPSVDLNCPIESDSNYRLYLRRMTSPKYLSNVVENKLYFKKQNTHQSVSRCDERKAFSNEFHKFKSKSSSAAFGPSTAKAIADSSSFRVYKMAADAKNYELPKLLIREGSPIESFHSSDNQMETLALRCDSPKSVISTPGSTIDISTSVTQTETMPVQLNSVLAPTTTDLIEPNALDQSPQLDTLLYEHGNGLEISFHDTTPDEMKGPSLVSNMSNKCNANDNCERLHNSKPSIRQTNDFPMFGSSPLLNYNSATTNSRCLDNIPLKHRRGYSNLKDACLSSSTSNIKDILRSNQYTKDSRSTVKSTTNTNSISSGNSISQEIFSLLRNHNNAPADYVRSYENLDRTKIIRIKNNSKRIIGNTNYGYHDGDTTTSYSKFEPNNGSNSSHSWRYGQSFEDEMKEEDDSTNYSYSNLGYENADTGTPATGFWNQNKSFQSDDSLFNINFDTVDDDVFHVDSLNFLDVNDCPPSEQNAFDGGATPSARELSKQSKNNQVNKCDDQLNYGLSTAGVANLMGSNDGNMLGFERNTIKFSTKANEAQTRTNHLEVGTRVELNQTNTVKATVIKASVLASSGAIASDADKHPPKSLRCAECNKKLGIIMVMKCHCEKVFCSKHRYAEAHNCSYDFKREGQKTIAKENPLVVASKVTKI